MPLPEPGETLLGKYTIERPLGTGGMGTVFAARHVTLGDPVALKFLLPDLAARSDIADRFLREARAGRSITSVHVAKVHDIDRFGDVPFIVMDHLDGETLAAYLARRGALPVDEAVDFILQASEAVNEAHTLGIVHRDIKPTNLFLTRDKGGSLLLKVLDFGISKHEDVAVTSSDSSLGTPLYMSPEQVDDSAQVDARTDVWSLAVVLFELLTGKRPFEGSNRSAIYVAIKSGRRPTVSALKSDIPPRLEEALDRALALLPENRFASVEAFAAAIAEFGTKGAAASLEQIQRVAERASSPAVPSEALAPVHTAAGREVTSLAGSVAATPPPALMPAPPSKSRSRLSAGIGALALAASVGAIGLRSHWFSGRPAAASTVSENAACASGATPACEAACTAQEPGACYGLARALRDGKGAPANPARAMALFQAECDAGGMAGCNSVGNLYDLGVGVKVDHDKALSLFQQACKGGFGPGCVNVGNAFADGKFVLKDDHQARRFYGLACDAGEPFGCSNLSIFLHEGRGGPKDLVGAHTHADKACTQGVAAACANAAKETIVGEGVAKDTNAGIAQLDAMCTRGTVEGCKTLANVYEQGFGDVQPSDDKQREYLKKACELHDTESCGKARLQKTETLTATMPARINAALRDQCNAGRMKSCEMLGRNLVSGVGVPKDEVGGAEYLAKACKGGVATACGVGGR